MSKGQQTRKEIIRLAAPIFNQKGFSGTALSDLMDATGLEKGGIYRHFRSKQQLAAESFDYTWRLAFHKRTHDTAEIANSVDRLKQIIRNFADRTGLVPGGCPILNTATEADDSNPHLRRRARKALDQWSSHLARILEAGKSRREVRRNVQSRRAAVTIISTLEGALMMARLQKSDAPLHNAIQHLDAWLESDVRA